MSVNIASDGLSGLPDQELEQKLNDIVAAVTKELQSTTESSFASSNESEKVNPIGADDIELDGEIPSQARPRKLSGNNIKLWAGALV